MRSCLVLSVFSFVASLSGCGPVDSEASIPAEARGCPAQFGEDFPETRAVDIGDASSGTFVPYADGAGVRLILGNQGSMMITPWVQVEALPGDAEETCHVVRLANEFEGPLADDPDGLASAQFNVRFIKAGAFLVSDGALYQPFAWDRETLEGQELELTVTVRGDGYEGTKSVSIALE
ncbi:hypothetical protein [Sorangium cellulosum]|uniref:hypothetical protein n=1 Tax=Sorangium cellulosum TaxID=56 RepID=UPI00077906DC|nr:hypothetical protein [Sorangium cellulosum]